MLEFNVHHFEVLRGTEQLAAFTIPNNTQIGPEWDPQIFRQFLLHLGTGGKGIKLIDTPSRIDLNESLHQTLNQMRRQHVDGFERYSPLGYNPRRKSIHIANILTLGSRNEVTADTQIEEKQIAFKQGIENIFGSMHSHPTMFGFVIEDKYVSPTFSLNDIYQVITKQAPVHLEFLADDHTNQLLLPTSDTRKVALDENRVSQLKYVEKTSREYGDFQDDLIERSQQGFMETDAKYWKMAIAECRKYKVALYRALPNKPLQRIYP